MSFVDYIIKYNRRTWFKKESVVGTKAPTFLFITNSRRRGKRELCECVKALKTSKTKVTSISLSSPALLCRVSKKQRLSKGLRESEVLQTVKEILKEEDEGEGRGWFDLSLCSCFDLPLLLKDEF